MTEKEERAIRVRRMLLEAEMLAMESKRLGRKFEAAGAFDHEDRRDYDRELGHRSAA